MERNPTQNKRSLHWLVRACQLFWRSARFVWGAIILNVVLSILVTLAFTAPSSFSTLPAFTWVTQNYLVVASVFGITLLLTILSLIGSRLPPTVFAGKVKRTYLFYIISTKKMLALEGIPRTLMSRSVPLDEVFIPLRFHLNTALTDYPPTDDEYRRYLEMSQRGEATEQMERFLLEAERAWQQHYADKKEVGIAELWQILTRDTSVAVIQGFLGMGKSTLLARLALFMARWSLDLDTSDTLLSVVDQKPLIPIILSLKDYSDERNNPRRADHLSLSDYLKIALEKLELPLRDWDIDNLLEILQKALGAGKCLVMFDGLDEVTERQERMHVQDEIKLFINKWQGSPRRSSSFNRFLITSRMAGYDHTAFPSPSYIHCTIASLMPQQIEAFLPRWFRASVRYERGIGNESGDVQTQEDVSKAAKARAVELNNTIKLHGGVQALAQNPLLLTLLAAILRGGRFSKIRAELYQTVTLTMLESRNERIGLEPIFEAIAVQRLGPLAYRMHEKGEGFALESEVLDSLRQTIAGEGGPAAEVEAEAKAFFERVRERGGILVQRTDHYYGFFHECFQQYYVARFMIDRVKDNLDQNIPKLIEQVRKSAESWSEPFVLAVTFEGNATNIIASRIIQELLTPVAGSTDQQKEQDLLLAAECVIEANQSPIDSALKRRVALELFQTYEESLQRQRTQACSRIESAVQRWLQSLPPSGTYSYALHPLRVFCEIIQGQETTVKQKTALTLLVGIADKLSSCSPVVFEELLPLLLKLTGLPHLGQYQPASSLSFSIELEIQQLGVIATSDLIGANHRALCQATLEMISHLSVSTANEILFVKCIAENTTDNEIREAALSALRRAVPQTAEAVEVLKSGRQSKLALIQEIVEEHLQAASTTSPP